MLRILCICFFSLAFASCQEKEAGVERDVIFGEVEGKKLLLDIFAPTSPASKLRPAVIWVHGGGWSDGSKSNLAEGAKALSQQGYVCFSINYRLVSKEQNRWPAQLDDVQRAVRWVRANAERYQVDSKRIGAIGHSAGGHLVTCLGTRDTRDNSDVALSTYSSRIVCAVNMSGPVDLVNFDSPIGNGVIRNLLGGTPAELPELAKDASPIYNVDAKSSPFLIIHGRMDDLVPPNQVERLDEALRAAGVESQLMIFEDEGHAVTKPVNSAKMIQEILKFLEKHLMP